MRHYREITPPAGFAPRPGRWIASLGALRARTIAMIEDLDPEILAVVPAAVPNSIGTLATHIAEIEAFWILERIGGHPLPATRREIYRMDLFGKPGAPQAPRAPARYLIGILDDLRVESCAVLVEMGDDDLDGKRVWVDPDSPQDQELFTVEWILQHVFAHEAHHQGQIALIRRLVSPGDAARAR